MSSAPIPTEPTPLWTDWTESDHRLIRDRVLHETAFPSQGDKDGYGT